MGCPRFTPRATGSVVPYSGLGQPRPSGFGSPGLHTEVLHPLKPNPWPLGLFFIHTYSKEVFFFPCGHTSVFMLMQCRLLPAMFQSLRVQSAMLWNCVLWCQVKPRASYMHRMCSVTWAGSLVLSSFFQIYFYEAGQIRQGKALVLYTADPGSIPSTS